MVVPLRPRITLSGAAAAVVAALLLSADLLAAPTRPAAPTALPPLSLAVWLNHFPGEAQYYADLTRSFEQAAGRKVNLYTQEWSVCADQLKRWCKDQRAYAPDMVVVRDVDLPLVLGHIASLEGRFPASFLRQLYPGPLAQGRVQGILVAAPWQVWPKALYYRGDILRQKGLAPPKTPDELLTVARAVADPPKLYGFGLSGRLGGGAADMFLLTLRAEGGVIFDRDGHLAVGADPSRRALKLWSDLTQSHATQPEVLSWTDAELGDLFLEGRLAMLIERPWLLAQFRYTEPPFEVGIVPVPKAPGGCDSPRTDCVVVFDTASDPDACCQFIYFALLRDQQRLLAKCGVPSACRDANDTLPDDARWAAFRTALANVRGPSPQSWGAVAALYERLLYLIVSGRIGVDEALEAMDVDLLGEPDNERLAMPTPSSADGKPREKL